MKNIEQRVNEAIDIFKENNKGKTFTINLYMFDRNSKNNPYPEGKYCHCVRIYWDRFYDRLCGNGWMWGQDLTPHFDDDGKIIISDRDGANNSFGFKYSTTTGYTDIIELLKNKII